MITLSYNRRKAVDYAAKWALSRNPDYYDYKSIGGDCTNFASQCVYAGAKVMNFNYPYGWYYIDANNKSPSWTGVQFFYEFMIRNKEIGPFGADVKLEELQLGDIIQLGDDNGEFYHTLVLTGITPGFFGLRNYYVSSHTRDVYQKNLFSYDFAQYRGIHILGARVEDEYRMDEEV